MNRSRPGSNFWKIRRHNLQRRPTKKRKRRHLSRSSWLRNSWILIISSSPSSSSSSTSFSSSSSPSSPSFFFSSFHRLLAPSSPSTPPPHPILHYGNKRLPFLIQGQVTLVDRLTCTPGSLRSCGLGLWQKPKAKSQKPAPKYLSSGFCRWASPFPAHEQGNREVRTLQRSLGGFPALLKAPGSLWVASRAVLRDRPCLRNCLPGHSQACEIQF